MLKQINSLQNVIKCLIFLAIAVIAMPSDGAPALGDTVEREAKFSEPEYRAE